MTERAPANVPRGLRRVSCKVLKTAHRSGGTNIRIPITARELVEWTYAEQRAQGVVAVTVEPQGRSQTGVALDLLTEFALLGCNVDRSPAAVTRWGDTKCHEDALTVHGIISDMRVSPDGPLTPAAGLLIKHGRQRNTPDWQPKIFLLRCVPVMGRRGSERGTSVGSGRDVVGHEVTYEGDWPSRDVATQHQIAADAHMRLWAEQSNWPATRPSGPPVHWWRSMIGRRCHFGVAQMRCCSVHGTNIKRGTRRCGGRVMAWTPPARGLYRYRISGIGAAGEPWSTPKKAD